MESMFVSQHFEMYLHGEFELTAWEVPPSPGEFYMHNAFWCYWIDVFLHPPFTGLFPGAEEDRWNLSHAEACAKPQYDRGWAVSGSIYEPTLHTRAGGNSWGKTAKPWTQTGGKSTIHILHEVVSGSQIRFQEALSSMHAPCIKPWQARPFI